MDIKLKFGFLALLIIIFQSFLKVIGVVITGSLSFLSETIDTIIDIFFVSLTIYSIYISEKPADFEHMYGHSKIDSIGALVQGIILIAIYGFLIFIAIEIIINQNFIVENPTLGLEFLIISIIVNLLFSRVLIWQGKKKKSLSLKVQGLNLFQDSLRAIITIVNFIFVIFFDITYLDPIFSIIISVIIMYSALKLSIEGVQNLMDENPINSIIIENLKQKIFNIDHVNNVEELKIRGSSDKLFLEVKLAVEDHISIAHANEITKIIRKVGEHYFLDYNVETVIEMNPMSGEDSLSEEIINLIHSTKIDYPQILEIRELNVFRIEKNYFLSLTIIVNQNLSLKMAHQIITKFENDLKLQVPLLSRIISHIEGKSQNIEKSKINDIMCLRLNPDDIKKVKNRIEEILRSKSYIKGYHGFEIWNTSDFCFIEIHVFFDGNLNITVIHDYTTEIEKEIQEKIQFDNLKEIIIHSEPLEGRMNGEIF